ncbi:MAG TPA: hypothetical protein VKA15_09945 [Isosphaeraceae bacterium]|nr:hypothetical protein [Isosphaeraceae bacterium]
MTSSLPAMTTERDLEARWREREAWWRRKLGRLRLGVEPLEEQVARYRRVTWALTVVPAILAIMFVALFTAFGRPDIGLILVAILLVPIVLGAWLNQALLARRARRYLAELEEYRRASEKLSTVQGASTEGGTTDHR